MWVVMATLGCGGGGEGGTAPAEQPRSRFDAVLVDPNAKVTPPEEFCEQFAPAETAKPFTSPVLDGEAWSPPKGWRWVNVWATWCAPCVAEMPRLVEWRDKLAKDGKPIDLVFLSVDADKADLDRFYAKQKNFPPTVRIGDTATLPSWLDAVGLDAGTPIPIHLFLDGENRMRCIRTGSISENDYPAVKQVIGG
jgi:thiol-disulfide isomerase/thioredoxin